MSDETPQVKYVTVTNPSQIRGRKPCDCGCGGQRHRIKVVMDEWAQEGPDGKLHVPVFWATMLSAGERDRHNASLEDYDKKLGMFRRFPEWVRPHWLGACLRDHENHRVWESLEAARAFFEERDDADVEKLFDACNKAQARPGRAEGNADVPSETTDGDKPSGESPSALDTPALITT